MSDGISYLESRLQKYIEPDLVRGRPDFDLPHTRAVVHWIKRICNSEQSLDLKILLTAAYAHDWGYTDLFESSPGIDSIHRKRKTHMQVGAEKIRKLLTNRLFRYYNSGEIERIVHLVSVHDNLDVLKDDDEIALMEADTFGSLDTVFVKPTFSKQDNDIYIHDQVGSMRAPLFRHQIAIKMLPKLVKKRLHFYIKQY